MAYYFKFMIVLLLCVSANIIAETPPQKVATCAGCHGKEGKSATPLYPNLAGQHAAYLKKQLEDFRSGKRADPVMGVMAKTLTDDEIKSIADYYSSH